MRDQDRVTVSESAQDRTPGIIETAGLRAEYSTGCTPTGEWFALGTIVRNVGTMSMPAWVLVGTGVTVDEAVQSLTNAIGSQARNVELV